MALLVGDWLLRILRFGWSALRGLGEVGHFDHIGSYLIILDHFDHIFLGSPSYIEPSSGDSGAGLTTGGLY